MTDEISLRDKIAMSVLAGMHVNALGVKHFGDVKSTEFLDLLATTAYRTADAMLRAREIGPHGLEAEAHARRQKVA